MSFQIRRDTNANRTTFTPDPGELFFATDTKRVWVGDGATAGGVDPFATNPYGDVFNVKLYGAVGDAVTNDTAAIQAAIDACILSGGGNVEFPTGLYVVIDGLTIDLSGTTGDIQVGLVGAGKHNARIISRSTGTTDCLTINGWNTAARSFYIQNLGFSKSTGTGRHGILAKNCARGEINNCYIYGFSAGAGVKFDADTNKNSDFNKIVSTYIGACQDGAWFDYSGASGGYCDAHMISDSSIVSNSQYDIRMTNTGGAAGKANAHFVDNTWVQCLSTGVHGLYIDNDVSAVKVSNTNFDGQPATTCITIAAGSTYTLLSNIAVDGGYVDNSGNAQLNNCHFTATGFGSIENRSKTVGLIPSAAPSSPLEGMVYYDTTANKLKVYNGTTWETITSA